MNDDDVEDKLQALAHALPRPDPTPAWKADILARASREASPRLMPPRWLLLTWVIAWSAILSLNFLTHREKGADLTGSTATHSHKPARSSEPIWEGSPPMNLAFYHQLNLNLDTAP